MIADLSGSLGVQPYQAILGKLQELEQEKSKLVLQEAVRFFEERCPEVPLKTTHKTGFLVDCLSDFEKEADIVILGKRGENQSASSGVMTIRYSASTSAAFVTTLGQALGN